MGEKIPESELIVDPEPFEERMIKVGEFEKEGQAFEEFLLNLVDYQDVVKAKTDRWKLQINRFQKQATRGDEAVEKLKVALSEMVEFWEGVKVSNPMMHLNSVLST